MAASPDRVTEMGTYWRTLGTRETNSTCWAYTIEWLRNAYYTILRRSAAMMWSISYGLNLTVEPLWPWMQKLSVNLHFVFLVLAAKLVVTRDFCLNRSTQVILCIHSRIWNRWNRKKNGFNSINLENCSLSWGTSGEERWLDGRPKGLNYCWGKTSNRRRKWRKGESKEGKIPFDYLHIAHSYTSMKRYYKWSKIIAIFASIFQIFRVFAERPRKDH